VDSNDTINISLFKYANDTLLLGEK